MRDALADMLGPEHVTIDPRTLAAAGIPMVPGGRQQHPACLVRPAAARDIAALLRYAARESLVVVPRGTGSRRGFLRPRAMILLDMGRLSHVVRLDELSLLAHVQAGITAHRLETLLGRRDLTLGDYPAAALRSTMGGLVAIRTAEKTSPRHGFLFDQIMGLSAVLPDGRTVHTRVAPRRATGPDFAAAFLGAEGALGIVTDVVVRLHRRSESRRFGAYRMPTMESALKAAFVALRQGARPAAMRIYDAPEAAAYLGADLAWMDEVVVTACSAGTHAMAEVDADIMTASMVAQGGRMIGPEVAETWWEQRSGRQLPELAPPPPTLYLAASPGRLGPVYRALARIAMRRGRALRCHVARFDADGACLYVTLMEGEEPDLSPGLRRHLIEAAVQAGAFAPGRPDPALAPYLSALRKALDPAGVCNPSVLPEKRR